MNNLGYHIRTKINILLWIFGISIHNKIDGECCPDFSCCYPDIHTPFHKRLRRGIKDIFR